MIKIMVSHFLNNKFTSVVDVYILETNKTYSEPENLALDISIQPTRTQTWVCGSFSPPLNDN